MRTELQALLVRNPEAAFVDVDNVRAESGSRQHLLIASAFLESLLTNPQVCLAAPGNNTPLDRPNDLVMALNTNDGHLSPDLLNRALPIRLDVRGDIDERVSLIGNPKLEFLPENQAIIEAELHGMIARWIVAGRPLDEDVSHPMSLWAKVIGGILKANGFTDFLANYTTAKVVDDPMRAAIGTLAAEHIDEPKSASEWVVVARSEGVLRILFGNTERENDTSMARAMGVILARRLGETFVIDRDGQQIRVKLYRKNIRWNPGETGSRKYVFRVVAEDAEVADEPVPDAELSDELLALESVPEIPLPSGTPKRKPR